MNSMIQVPITDSGSLEKDFPGVSIILPILNEERHLASAIGAILEQNYAGPLEVILAIGPGKDRTLEIAHELQARDWRIMIVNNPTGRTATGLNAAIAASKFPVICRIDGHAEISRSYVSDAVALLRKTGAVNVGGIMAASGRTEFEKAVATAMRSPLGVGAARFHTGGQPGPVDTVYLGTFIKSALVAIGGYDERFTRAQDWELNFRLRKAGGVIWFDPTLIVLYRPRPSIPTLSKQYFEYGRWRRVVARNHKGTINFRYLAPPMAVVVNLLSLVMGFVIHPLFFLPIVGYGFALLVGGIVIGKSTRERLILPFVLTTMHMSWGMGFLTSPPGLLAESAED